MRITFNGAARNVTGSQHLLEVNGKSIMLDCGLIQGKRKESFEKNRSAFCIDFVRVMSKNPQRTFVVHGEDDASTSLTAALHNELGLENVVIPDSLQSFEV